MRANFVAGIIVMTAMFMALPANADNVLKLLMPGPLAHGHAKLEAACGNCHVPLKKQAQRARCVACHKAIGKDIKAKRGFHGRGTAAAASECSQCHTEHKGRNADITGLDRDTFDHRVTDFALRGAHRRTACGGCHKPGRKFRQAPHSCIACHAKDEPHRGRLGKKCASCHTEASWSRVRFDHKRRTGFALTGKHRRTSCNSCHAGQRFENTPKDCYSCHRLNEPHAGRFGRSCAKCHTTKGWKGGRFDHDRDTKFALRGSHRKTACTSCHTKRLAGRKPARDCYSCHRADDTHKGRNGRDCARCHSETRWSTTSFDHGRATSFPLRGKHGRLACTLCHRGSVFTANLGKSCIDCHRDDDVHRGKLGRTCSNCHNEQGWGKRVAFDHDLTRFPLIGQHVAAPCEECHVSKAYKGTDRRCITCHADTDSHKGRLGRNCGQCHNPNGWALWRFDHNRQTDFALDGAHQGLTCIACHRTRVRGRIQLSETCGDCHQRDDTHRGGFGLRCDQCHDTKSFRRARFKR